MALESAQAESLRAEIDERLADAVIGHVWLRDLVTSDVAPHAVVVDVHDAVDALFALVGGMATALDRLAAEIDALKAGAA
jgi:hypothetical protein